MNKEDYQRMMEVFVGAGSLAGRKLEEYLEEKCQGDQELRDQVRWMIDDDRLRSNETAVVREATTAVSSKASLSGRRSEGQCVGEYELIEEIGRGGMGIVYRARQVGLNRIVALKMILSGKLASEAEIRRFRAEAEAAAALDHPGIVPIFEVGESGGDQYFSMGFVEGKSLAGTISDGPLHSMRAAELVRQIAVAVQFAHDRKVIHRDLKPANILVDASGHARITDFGLAKQMSDEDGLTATGQILGTPGYMAPEQAKGTSATITPAADIYGLGAILYCLLVGRPPFQSSTPVETLLQSIEREPVRPRMLNRDVHRDLETVCLKCLEKTPSRRYSSAGDVAKELQRVIDGLPIEARPISPVEAGWRWCARHRLVASLCLVLVVTTIAGISAVLGMWARAESNRSQAETNAEHAEFQRIAAIAATEDAVEQTVLAEQQRELADQQSQLTLDTLNMVVYQIQDRLQEIPEAYEVRQELLTSTLDGLENVSNSLISSPQRNRSLIQTRFALGDVLMKISGVTERDPIGLARSQFAIAREIAAMEYEKYPNDPGAVGDFMIANEKLGRVALLEFDLDEGFECYRQALELARDGLELAPNNRRNLWSVYECNLYMGYARFRQFRFEEASVFLTAARRQLDHLEELKIDVSDVGDPNLAPWAERLERVSLLAPQALEDEQFALAQDSDITVELMMLRAKYCIKNHQRDEALGILARIEEMELAPVPDEFNLACIYSRCLTLIDTLDDGVPSNPDENDLYEEMSTKAIAALRRFREAGVFRDPVLLGMVSTDPDLEFLREYPGYDRFVEEISATWGLNSGGDATSGE